MKRENVQTKLHSLWIYDIHVHTLHISIISQMSMNILNQNLSMTCTRIGIIYIPVLKYYQLTEALKASNLTRWGGKLHQIALYKYCGRWGGGGVNDTAPQLKNLFAKTKLFSVVWGLQTSFKAFGVKIRYHLRSQILPLYENIVDLPLNSSLILKFLAQYQILISINMAI